MKEKLALLGIFVLVCVLLNGQSTNQHFLKNYQAPDFKLRGLNFNFNTEGAIDQNTDKEFREFNSNFSLGYMHLSNQKRYQGNSSIWLNPYINYEKNSGEKRLSSALNLNGRTNNRIYFKDKWFLGVYGGASVSINQRKSSIDSSFFNYETLGCSFYPEVSIGHGRLEPVLYARSAVDIEKALKKANLIDQHFTVAERNALADQIAIIRNRRVFDTRLNRIRQLEDLDHLLDSMGIVSSEVGGMAYFSHLNDAFFYAHSVYRQSGFRHELGIRERMRFASTQSVNAETNYVRSISSLGVYTLSYHLPQSYAIQHDVKLSVFGGVRAQEEQLDFPAWLEGEYEFGLFPTTRTYLGASCGGALNLNDDDLRYNLRLGLNAYYYVSPRMRLSASGRFFSNNEFISNYDFPNNYYVSGQFYDLNIGFQYALF